MTANSLSGRAPGPSHILERYIRELDHVYPNWRYYAPPTGNQASASGTRQAAAAEIPDVEPVLMCEIKVGTNQVAVISKYGVQAIEYPRDADGRTFAQQLPPIALYLMAHWTLRFQRIENAMRAAGRNAVGNIPLDGVRVFDYFSSHNGETPIVQEGPGTIQLFMQIDGLAASPYQAPVDGLAFVGRLEGYTVPIPSFVPDGFAEGQPPPQPWNPKF